MSDAPIHSTGRGGAGNIGPDPNVYTDGEIIREVAQGESNDGVYSTGRGGAGNVEASPKIHPSQGRRSSQDFIPETALREPQENYHTGRGGEGNIHKEKYGGHSSPKHSPKNSPSQKPSVGDKIKHVLHLDKKHESSPLANESKD